MKSVLFCKEDFFFKFQSDLQPETMKSLTQRSFVVVKNINESKLMTIGSKNEDEPLVSGVNAL